MEFKPRTYQQIGIDHAIANPASGLFFDMGLGKTAVTLAVIDYRMYVDLAVDKCLVVAPLRVADLVWEEEVQKWDNFRHLRISKILGTPAQRKAAMRANADIYIINYENFVWLCAQFGGRLPYKMIVWDESSRMRNPKAKRFNAAKKACIDAEYVIELTGTPSPQSLLNLWAQLFLLDRGQRLGASITAYRSMYFKPAYTLPNGIVAKYNVQPGCSDLILDKIKDICISLKTEDCIDLPDVTYNYIKVKYSPEIMQQYEEFERDCVLALADVEIVALAAAGLRTKLVQYSNGAVYYTTLPGQQDWTEVHDEKIEALKELIEDGDGRPVLVAYYFKHDLIRLQAALAEYKPRCLKTNQDIKDWNEGKVQVMLAHPASAGHGLNLQSGGSTIIWFGLTDDLEIYQQFNKRLHRSGQTHKCIIHHLVGMGTYDEIIVEGLERKAGVQDSLIAGVNALRKKYAKELSSAR